MITLHHEIAELKRELAMREKHYKLWLLSGKIDKATATHRKECLKQTLERLEEISKQKYGSQEDLF